MTFYKSIAFQHDACSNDNVIFLCSENLGIFRKILAKRCIEVGGKIVILFSFILVHCAVVYFTESVVYLRISSIVNPYAVFDYLSNYISIFACQITPNAFRITQGNVNNLSEFYHIIMACTRLVVSCYWIKTDELADYSILFRPTIVCIKQIICLLSFDNPTTITIWGSKIIIESFFDPARKCESKASSVS